MNSSCCPPDPKPQDGHDHCAPKRRMDWLFWGSLLGVGTFYFLALVFLFFEPSLPLRVEGPLRELAHSTYSLMNEMAWGLAFGILFVGWVGQIPREFVIATLGRPDHWTGLVRATAAGLLLDLCNHGILLVAMRLYERGASLGQVIAFLVASPWNSFSLTLILFALIGLKWTLVFIAGSAVIAWVSGAIFNRLVASGRLPSNPNQAEIPKDFRFWKEARSGLAKVPWGPTWFLKSFVDGVKESRMILRWILFGTLLAVLIQVFVPTDWFMDYFGPSIIGLGLTLFAATIIEVCSEGSTPIAADLLNRAAAPGNAFTFLMAGAATDYTEIMSLRETTKSWKIALTLPLVTVPQVLLISWFMNQA